MSPIAQGKGETFENIVELVFLRGELGLMELHRHLPERQIVFADFFPDFPGFLVILGPDSQVAVQIGAFLVGQEQECPVHAETFTGSDGGQRYGQDFVKFQGGLENRDDFVKELNFDLFAVQKTGQGVHLRFVAI